MKLRLTVFPLFLFLLVPLMASAQVGVDLIAGRQAFVAGDVDVFPDGDNAIVYVAPYLDDGWLVRKVQVYFGEDMLPLTNSGNPKIGKFPIKKAYNPPADHGEPVIEGLCAAGQDGSDEIFLSVHVDLVKLDGSVVGAWADLGIPFTGRRFGSYGTFLRAAICGS
jgi:hypothetical protein